MGREVQGLVFAPMRLVVANDAMIVDNRLKDTKLTLLSAKTESKAH